MQLTLTGAFLGGILNLLSPCSAMLLPAFFSYAFVRTSRLLLQTAIFFLGLITTLVPLGALAGSLGAWVGANRQTLMTVAAWVVIALGLALAAGLPLRGLIRNRGAGDGSPLAVYLLGTVYGLAGVCAGPLLGAALALAAFGGSALLGAVTMLWFAAGMVLPLVILSWLWGRIPAVQRWVRPREIRLGRWRNSWSNVVGGILTAAIGVLLLVTNGTASLGELLGASRQARLESWVLQASAGIPNWLAIVVPLAIGGVWFAIWHAGRSDVSANGDEDERAVG